jgi:hypothetical protein
MSHVAAFVAASAVVCAGCGGRDDDGQGWRVEQAESVNTIRGMNVHVLRCRGLRGRRDPGSDRYSRFACEAGTRAPGDSSDIDTVGITYEIRVLGPDNYVLENVQFYGGPGIP